jgi:hypothetical protein
VSPESTRKVGSRLTKQRNGERPIERKRKSGRVEERMKKIRRKITRK